jgi:hypothetical protein
MASPSTSDNSTPSLSSDIQQIFPRDLSFSEEDRLDMLRVKEDARANAAGLARTTGATEPSSAYKNILLTDRQINYLLVILKPYLSPIAEECRVKLESA